MADPGRRGVVGGAGALLLACSKKTSFTSSGSSTCTVYTCVRGSAYEPDALTVFVTILISLKSVIQ